MPQRLSASLGESKDERGGSLRSMKSARAALILERMQRIGPFGEASCKDKYELSETRGGQLGSRQPTPTDRLGRPALLQSIQPTTSTGVALDGEEESVTLFGDGHLRRHRF
jgi:hypothetical protein